MSGDLERKNWREGLFRAIADLGNTEKQVAAWLAPEKPWHSFVEYGERMSDFILNGQESLDGAVASGFLNQSEVEPIAELYFTVQAYDPPNRWKKEMDDALIATDPAWMRVCSLARETKEALRATLNDDDELLALQEGDADMSPQPLPKGH